MNRSIKPLFAAIVAAAGCVSLVQAAGPDKPPHAMISIYRISTGKQADFLKWMAVRDAIDKEAGLPQAQWYAHVDGDSWDYVSIGPDPTPEQGKKVEEAMKKHGLATGFKQSLEVRQFIASHTDTFAVGPVTVSELSDWASK